MRSRIDHTTLLIATIAGTALLASCVWLSGNREPVYNVINAPIQGADGLDDVNERIRRAAQIQGWAIEQVGPDLFYVTKQQGQHSATASIEFDAEVFSIGLRGSSHLKQSEDRIHKLYNEWIGELEATIQRELSAER